MATDPGLAATVKVTVIDTLNTSVLHFENDSLYHEHHGPPYWTLPVKIIYSCTMLIFMLLAFIGNLMVLTVITRHKMMRTRTNLFIANLAMTDFLVSILNMPFSIGTVLYGDWPFGEVMCQINGFFMPLLFICSQHTLMYMALHKFFTIKYPFKRIVTVRRAVGMMSAAWIISGVLSVLALTGLNHILYKPFTTQCGPEYPQDKKGYIHVIIMTILTYVIPVFVMAFSFIQMFIEIRAFSHRLEKHTNQDKQTIIDQQKRAIVTMFIVMVMFLLCWTPYTVYAIASSIIRDKETIPHIVNAIVYLCGYMNSSLNPIIYGFRNRSFRNGYKEFFCQRDSGVMSEGDLQVSGAHSTLQRMTSTLSSHSPTSRQQSMKQNVNQAKKLTASYRSERQSLVSQKRPSFKDSAKKVSLSSGMITYMKNGKIIKVEYPKEKPPLKRQQGFDHTCSSNGHMKDGTVSDDNMNSDAKNGIVRKETHDQSNSGLQSQGDSEKSPTGAKQSGPGVEMMSQSSNLSLYDNVNDLEGDFKTAESDLEDEVFLPTISWISTESRPSYLTLHPRSNSGHENFGISPNSPGSPRDISPGALGSCGGDRNCLVSSPTRLLPVAEDTEDVSDSANCKTMTVINQPQTSHHKLPGLDQKPQYFNKCDKKPSNLELDGLKNQPLDMGGVTAPLLSKNNHTEVVPPHNTERRLSNRDMRADFWNTEITNIQQYYSPATSKKIVCRMPSMDSLSPMIKQRNRRSAGPTKSDTSLSKGRLYDIFVSDNKA
ncbi:melanopsin-A-like [Lineus longissimus]|uniref:melanopsin-A-like n=1 Tax=Lineus longissimus TaxID=88925 RepID=UPI00315D9D41